MSEFMVWVPPLCHYDDTPRLPVTKVASPMPNDLHASFAAIPVMPGPAGERSARRGQGHQILCHPEAGGITEVVPADAADWDDGEPLGCAWRTSLEKSTAGSPA